MPQYKECEHGLRSSGDRVKVVQRLTQNCAVKQTRQARIALHHLQSRDVPPKARLAMKLIDDKVLSKAEKLLKRVSQNQGSSSHQHHHHHGAQPSHAHAKPSGSRPKPPKGYPKPPKKKASRKLSKLMPARASRPGAPPGHPSPPPGYPGTSPVHAHAHAPPHAASQSKPSIAGKVMKKLQDPAFQDQAKKFVKKQARKYL